MTLGHLQEPVSGRRSFSGPGPRSRVAPPLPPDCFGVPDPLLQLRHFGRPPPSHFLRPPEFAADLRAPRPRREHAWRIFRFDLERSRSRAGQSPGALGAFAFAVPPPELLSPPRLTGPVQFFSLLLASWNLDSRHAPVLLGFDPGDESYVVDLLAGRVPLRGRDATDRIVHLYQIRKTLSGLFRDESVENAWLREPHEPLNERSPMDLLLEGSMEHLLLVREYVDEVAGL